MGDPNRERGKAALLHEFRTFIRTTDVSELDPAEIRWSEDDLSVLLSMSLGPEEHGMVEELMKKKDVYDRQAIQEALATEEALQQEIARAAAREQALAVERTPTEIPPPVLPEEPPSVTPDAAAHQVHRVQEVTPVVPIHEAEDPGVVHERRVSNVLNLIERKGITGMSDDELLEAYRVLLQESKNVSKRITHAQKQGDGTVPQRLWSEQNNVNITNAALLTEGGNRGIPMVGEVVFKGRVPKKQKTPPPAPPKRGFWAKLLGRP